MAASFDKVLATHQQVIEDGHTRSAGQNFRSYAISTLRGVVGKSSMAFNLAYEIARRHRLLVTDVCPQCNLTEMLLGETRPKANVYSALQPIILGPAFGEDHEDIAYRISSYCDSFKREKPSYMIAGNAELYAFPSTLYQQLNTAYAAKNQKAVEKLLHGLKQVLDRVAKDKGAEKILVDTSPFYAGATHLAWCAVDALIIPVRVDEHSLESLELMLQLLSDQSRDYLSWNERAGGLSSPKIAAIVMTMVGSKSQKKATPDAASRMYIERALGIAKRYPMLFGHDDPADAFVITDDFHSAGRISGAKRIPISELRERSFHTVDNKRLQVNLSVQRYKKQLAYLASMI